MSERQVALLRGINLGSRNRVPMARLRELLSGDGLTDARTYLQSGNVVLVSDFPPEELAAECERRITAEFGFEVPVVVRTRDELNDVVRFNPLKDVAANPKRYQVTFLSAALEPAAIEQLSALAAGSERLVARGRELYAWHPDGVARSRLSLGLAGIKGDLVSTARNWTTVTSLLEMTDA